MNHIDQVQRRIRRRLNKAERRHVMPLLRIWSVLNRPVLLRRPNWQAPSLKLSTPKISRAVLKRVALVGLVIATSFVFGLYFRNFIPVAIVNGEPVMRAPFAKKVLRTAGPQVLQDLIIKTVVKQELKAHDIKVYPFEIDQELVAIEAELILDGMYLNERLETQGVAFADFREELIFQLAAEKYLQSRIQVTDAEVEEYFREIGVERGEGAVLESQLIALRKSIYKARLKLEYDEWLAGLLDQAKVVTIFQI